MVPIPLRIRSFICSLGDVITFLDSEQLVLPKASEKSRLPVPQSDQPQADSSALRRRNVLRTCDQGSWASIGHPSGDGLLHRAAEKSGHEPIATGTPLFANVSLTK
jgi:hypothetical protein